MPKSLLHSERPSGLVLELTTKLGARKIATKDHFKARHNEGPRRQLRTGILVSVGAAKRRLAAQLSQPQTSDSMTRLWLNLGLR
jgi:hypothetical protein